ncbi:hypothetical protein BDW59DRAFT_167617 [Aspergillus cavernicola]|uniref:Uncharacterized protein n=1 Tax=Aspergillus cavernicola TaxID=176166 RepID=A0ABR4HE99_9EURO
MEGIMYLEDVDGRPTEGPGPGECSRVSCSWDSAIWWCNDTRETKSLRSFNDIAIGVQAIWSECSFREPGYNMVVSGQAFHKTNWNVIVRKDSC